MEPDIFTQIQEEVEVLDEKVDTRALVVHNDEFNTFDHVIETLVKICRHSPDQAEQCTLIVHYNGKCKVKEGGFTDLKPMKEAILDRGIQATIE